MNALSVLIPVALLLGVAGLVGFLWSLRSGQFEDLDGAGMRILIDDEDALGANNDNTKKTVDEVREPK